jgi:hypothetical protein
MKVSTPLHIWRLTTMKQSINDQLMEIYVLIDDYLKALPQRAQGRRSPKDEPGFTDAEMLTVGLMQGYFGCATLKQTYLLVKANARSSFSHLCSYQQGRARSHALMALVGQRVEATRPSEGEPMSLRSS